MPKIVEQDEVGDNWRFLVVTGNSVSGSFEVNDSTDYIATANEYLGRFPDANIYALLEVETITTRRLA